MKKKNFILVIFALSIFLFVSFQTTDFQNDTKSISKIDENPNILFANIPFQFKTQFENIISKMDFLKSEPKLLELFKIAYPNVTFVSQYDVKNLIINYFILTEKFFYIICSGGFFDSASYPSE